MTIHSRFLPVLFTGILWCSLAPALPAQTTPSAVVRAQALAAAGRHREAISLYRQVLAQSPENRDARIGLGHTLAWRGRYAAAADVFRQMLVTSPTDTEVEKGLGYVALWRGESGVAAGHFKRLAARFPNDDEYRTALGLSYLAEYRSKAARAEFDRAVQLNPNSTARQFYKAADLKMGWIEADVWGSWARRAGDNSFALRDLMLSWQANRHFRLFARYDDALATDYLALMPASGGRAPAYSAGVVSDFKKIGISRFEAGGRSIPGGAPNQTFVLLEHTYLFPRNANLRGGALAIFPDNGDAGAWTLYGGGRLPLGRQFALEPALYHTFASGDQPASTRELLALNWRSAGGYVLTAGFLFGKPAAENDPNLRDTWLRQRYLFAVLPVSRKLWLMATLRDEPGLDENIFHFDLGLKLRLER